ncbi:polysaccharide biosynthesis protein [Halocola ammonii]
MIPVIPKKNTPRWIVFTIDACITSFAFLLAYLVRFEFSVPSHEVDLALKFFGVFLGVRLLSFWIGKTYAGIIRYTGTQDAQRIFTVLTIGSVLFAALNLIRFYIFDGKYFLPFSVIIIEYLFTLFIMVVSRIALKTLYRELKTPAQALTRVAIFGAGESGFITKRTLDESQHTDLTITAFIDDDKRKAKKKLEGVKIFHSSKIDELFDSGNIDQLIISVQQISRERKAELVNQALKYNVKVLNVPPVKQWINGELSLNQIRNIRIEDLLGRDAITLDNKSVRDDLKGKTVLVTGAAGSIGSELARQINAYDPEKLVLFDQSESPLYDLQNEMKFHEVEGKIDYVIGDIRQLDRIKRLFDFYKPQVVFHAAAYKHVPLMEDNPSEAVLTNVLGTKNLVDTADQFGVEKFVMISTDKAVNPTNIMGATKRVAEMYAQSKDAVSKTNFVTTRFGNVLGSNGSVIPLFKKQIEDGGPLTVTHPEVTRYFMTIPEAVQLVLEAGAMGEGGEIFVFDMGQSIKIIDLAKNMVKLMGLELGKDIEIKFTGLRPGEKLFEELLTSDENTTSTHHPKIMRARVRKVSFDSLLEEVRDLISLFDRQDNATIVKKLKELVPEYISNNSIYSKLDAPKEAENPQEENH